MDAGACRIAVSRRHGKDVRDRQIIVSLDGEPLATLLFGEEVTRQIAPGAHRLRAHNTLFWKTRDVELQPGEHARFAVINRPVLTSPSGMSPCGRVTIQTRPGWRNWQTLGT